MSDEHPTQPLPDPTARWVLQTDAPASAKPRRWPWLIAVLVIVGLVVAAWFAGEYIARGIVDRTIRDQITTELAVPADQPIDIDIPGPILPQLIIGSFAKVTISSDDLPLGGDTATPALVADVVVTADDVHIRGDGDWSSATATVTLDEAQLEALLGTIDGFPADTVTLDPPEVGISMDLQVLALTVPVGVDLAARAENGQLVLTPTTLRVAGAEISADALVAQFGAIATTVIRDWDVCLAQYYPAAIDLTGVTVERTGVVADLEISSAILHDPAAREPGTCA
ncbi:MAG: hypothetical protein ABS62_03575 [Microbacterium sp. SCN 70-200]|uniref:LmeA family phospholipid-binding protein n=1 Tax=unclassified Microbacterium TaxID=2609290 RepID=UPI00086E3B32|nr:MULTISPECIES: DUF2993 domain-containing protein [unclassified Microbacterium]MBN9213947.1 DUF2993 domain-containing protein [Microbacterium sp.]ODT42523.1 MAG: hypothetical protein ABS62_03575 [Microbacterium sp. SCN 70-200]OJV85388.1 MAG: hypothetical protein BGO46_08690 [Microbacterium sp. 70-16]